MFWHGWAQGVALLQAAPDIGPHVSALLPGPQELAQQRGGGGGGGGGAPPPNAPDAPDAGGGGGGGGLRLQSWLALAGRVEPPALMLVSEHAARRDDEQPFLYALQSAQVSQPAAPPVSPRPARCNAAAAAVPGGGGGGRGRARAGRRRRGGASCPVQCTVRGRARARGGGGASLTPAGHLLGSLARVRALIRTARGVRGARQLVVIAGAAVAYLDATEKFTEHLARFCEDLTWEGVSE
jgi:hypothetical protein